MIIFDEVTPILAPSVWDSLTAAEAAKVCVMHDAKGRELQVGDRVLIPAVVTRLDGGETYCNVAVETTIGRRPDGMKENMSAINTGVLLRANEEDDNSDAFSIAGPA